MSRVVLLQNVDVRVRDQPLEQVHSLERLDDLFGVRRVRVVVDVGVLMFRAGLVKHKHFASLQTRASDDASVEYKRQQRVCSLVEQRVELEAFGQRRCFEQSVGFFAVPHEQHVLEVSVCVFVVAL